MIYEYKVTSTYINHLFNDFEKKLEAMLNSQSSNGWELFMQYAINGEYVVTTFRREVINSSTEIVRRECGIRAVQ